MKRRTLNELAESPSPVAPLGPRVGKRHGTPWRGHCPDCGGQAVFLRVDHTIIGGCEAGPPCYWAGELDDA